MTVEVMGLAIVVTLSRCSTRVVAMVNSVQSTPTVGVIRVHQVWSMLRQ
jgi:hypothetical protein